MSDLPLISTGNPDLMNSPNTTQQKNTLSNDFFNSGSNGNTTQLENSSKHNTSNSQNLPHLMTPYSLGHHSNLEDTLILQRLLNSGGPGNNMGVINDSAIKNNKNITDFNARPSSVFQWENISSDFLLSSPDLIRDVLQQSINNSNSQVKNTNQNNYNNAHSNLNIPTSVSPVSNILNSLFKTPAKNTLGNSGRGTNSAFNMLNFNSSIKKLTPLKFVTDSNRKMDPLLLEMSEIKVESIPNPNTTSTTTNNNTANNSNTTNNNTIHHQPRPQSFIPVTSLTGETLNIPYNNGVIGFVNNGISNRSLISTSPSLSRPHHMKRRNTFEPIFDDKENIIISNSNIHGEGDKGKIDSKLIKKNKKPLVKHKTTIKKRKLSNSINNDTTIPPPVHPETSNVLKPIMKSFVFKESSSIIHTETSCTTDEEDGDGVEDSVNSSQATIELNFSAKKTTPLLPHLAEMTLTTSTNSIESSDILGNVSPTPKYKKKSRNTLPKLHKSFSTTTPTTNAINGNKMLNRSVSGDTTLSITGLPKMGSFSRNKTSNTSIGLSSTGKHFSKNSKKTGSSSMSSEFQNGNIAVSKKKNNSHNSNSSMNSFSSNNSHNKSFQIVFTDPNVFENLSENTSAMSNTSNTSFNNSLIYSKNASSTPASRGSSFSSFQFNNSNSAGRGMKRKKKTSSLKRANSDVCNFSSSSSNSLKKR